MKIEEARQAVEKRYVGFSPSSSSIKPVHIANGMFRMLMERKADTSRLFKFAYTNNEKGQIPRGHDISTVYANLAESSVIDSEAIKINELSKLRIFAKKIISADSAVFGQSMASYTAGFKGFVSGDTIAQDSGELIAAMFSRLCPEYADTIKEWLEDDNDILSVFFKPVLSEGSSSADSKFSYDDQHLFFNRLEEIPASYRELLNGSAIAFGTLSRHLKAFPNKLVSLRSTVLLACFLLIRHMSCLEGYYTGISNAKPIPILLDFSQDRNEPIARASMMNYTLICQSVARFYAWAFGKHLSEEFSIDELLAEAVPEYKGKQADKEIWELAKDDIRTYRGIKSDEELYTIMGAAVYDMLALEASSNPVACMRQIGVRGGIFYPPVNTQPTKRFILQQDILEMLVRGAIDPGDTIDIQTLQNNMWDRYGIIIGGRHEDEAILKEHGIYQADGNALKENCNRFVEFLRNLNFARLMADGVLQIELEELQ